MREKVINDKKYIKEYWQELFIEMLANPVDSRTTEDFCKELGIEKEEVTRWLKNHRKDVFNEVHKKRNEYFNEIRQNAWKQLNKKVNTGDTNSIMLLFKLLGDLVEKSESKIDMMSEEDRKRRYSTLLDEINKKKAAWSKVLSPETDKQGPPSKDNV